MAGLTDISLIVLQKLARKSAEIARNSEKWLLTLSVCIITSSIVRKFQVLEVLLR